MVAKFGTNASGATYNWSNLEPMQVAFYLAGEKTQVKESIPWVRCASGNVLNFLCDKVRAPYFKAVKNRIKLGGWECEFSALSMMVCICKSQQFVGKSIFLRSSL